MQITLNNDNKQKQQQQQHNIHYTVKICTPTQRHQTPITSTHNIQRGEEIENRTRKWIASSCIGE